MNITRLERETKDIGTKLSQLFFHYYQIEDQTRERDIFRNIVFGFQIIDERSQNQTRFGEGINYKERE